MSYKLRMSSVLLNLGIPMESLIQIRAKVDGGNACPRATDPGCAGKQHGKKRAPGEMCIDVCGVMAMQYDLRLLWTLVFIMKPSNH